MDYRIFLCVYVYTYRTTLQPLHPYQKEVVTDYRREPTTKRLPTAGVVSYLVGYPSQKSPFI